MNEAIVRAPTLDDAQGVAALIAERDRADFAEVDSISFTGDELREWWRLDEAALETDAWIALRDGEVVAYARADRERDLANGFRALWQRGQTHVGLEVDSGNETGATRLYERAGMRVTRRYATYEKALV